MSLARRLDRQAHALGIDRIHVAVAALALLAATVALALSLTLFPYHSLNHDEAVYLQQAAMLLEGQLFLRPPVPDAFRPWFFAEDGARLYPKYAPVPAAIFALGEAVAGSYRASLAGVAAAVVALTYAVTAEAFDRRTGVLAAGALLASPLFVLQSAVFLPYAPTATLNLAFAWAYLRGVRTGDRRWHAAAGAAVGLAFFARPYTAVLFAAPFVAHALWQLRRESFAPPELARHAATAALGLAGVGLTLAYNAAVTGDPLLFPYEAFAPADGLGFGHREIAGYERDYTPALALRANAEVVARLLWQWVPGGVAGTALAVLGLASLAVSGRSPVRRPKGRPALAVRRRGDRLDARLALAGVAFAVVAGNVYFWGNLNVLGSLADPNDGLLSYLGPHYHFDVLAPVAALAAHGALVAASWVRDRAVARGHDSAGAARAGIAALVLAATVVAGVGFAGAAAPLDRNADVTAEYRAAYAPFADGSPDDAVLFLPTPYGDWLAHPFQALHNRPGFDGPAVYALDRGGGNFAVVDAYPDRSYYRYVYRGAWTPTGGERVDAALRRVRVVSGDGVTLDATLGVPQGVERASIRLAAGNDSAYYAVNGTPDELPLRLVAADGRARLAGDRVTVQGENDGVPLPDRGEVTVEVFLDHGAGSGFSYRLALPVESAGDGVRALTPYHEVCQVPDRCGGEAAYLPSRTRAGFSMNVSVEATDADESA